MPNFCKIFVAYVKYLYSERLFGKFAGFILIFTPFPMMLNGFGGLTPRVPNLHFF